MTNNTVFKKGDIIELAVSKDEFSREVDGGIYFFKCGAINANLQGTIHDVTERGSVILEDNGTKMGSGGIGGVLFPSELYTIRVVDTTS